jgi:hypothetical protein
LIIEAMAAEFAVQNPFDFPIALMTQQAWPINWESLRLFPSVIPWAAQLHS